MSKFWQHFLNNGHSGPKPGYLGVEGYGVPLRRRLTAQFQLQQSTGVEVQRVATGSPAEDAGILEGDILLTLADRELTSADELQHALAQVPADIPLSIVLLRNDRCLERLVMTQPTPRPQKRNA